MTIIITIIITIIFTIIIIIIIIIILLLYGTQCVWSDCRLLSFHNFRQQCALKREASWICKEKKKN